MSKIIPVIMCGGSGTRLWPLSRRLEPKQFQKLVGDSSLFQDTLQRFDDPSFGRAMVLVNTAHEPRVQIELEQAAIAMPEGRALPQVVIEPAIRSTAPAIAAAAVLVAEEDPDAIMLVVPSDHRVGRPERLLEAYLAAIPFVSQGGIALFGIRPTAPETGFGYICAADNSEFGMHRVEAFIEKPDIERAHQLVADPRHTWNSGIFMFRASTILEELSRLAPEVLQITAEAVETGTRHGNSVSLAPCYGDAPEISIDHAVMEHSQQLGVLPVSPEWNDLGSFEALWEVSDRNGDDNVILGEAVIKDVRRSYIRAGRRLVSVVGLSNIVIVDTEDALLVASRAQSQDVKFIAQRLAAERHPAADLHVVQQRTGGISRILEQNDRYRVEHLTVFAGQEMQLAVEPVAARRTLTMVSGSASLETAAAMTSLDIGKSVAPSSDIDLIIRNPSVQPIELLLTVTLVDQLALADDHENQKKVG